MFDILGDGDPADIADAAVSAERLAEMVEALGRLDSSVDDAGRVDQIRLLEQLKSAAAAAQAVVTTGFVASQKAAQTAAGVTAKNIGKGLPMQVGLARRESPNRATFYVGWAQILTTELPCTFAALQRGDTCERRAMIVARETGWLSRKHRAQVDEALADKLGEFGDKRLDAEIKKMAYRLDPHGYVARQQRAENERRVTLRPAPEGMAYLTALLPMKQGVASWATLKIHADSVRAGGDERGRGQVMADTLVERVTGQTTADSVPVGIDLVMTDATLFNRRPGTDSGSSTNLDDYTDPTRDAGADEPAYVDGYGPTPADLARRLITEANEAKVWLRRLYTDPETGALMAMESRSRLFPEGLRKFLVIRDQICRTPWCDAPIRHADHVIPAEVGGPTSADNGQGLCEACNQAKQAPGWRARPSPAGAGDSVTITTPTGHTYDSRAPDPPGWQESGRALLRRRLPELFRAA